MSIVKKDVITSTGSLQVCAGQEAGAEAAIHAMHNIYETEECEAVLLIDAENAFNSSNRKAMLHNISIICPIISNYITNSYTFNSRLFIIGGKEIRSKEGTAQGDPTSTGAYILGITPLIQFLHEFIIIKEHDSKEVAFADDLAAAGKINEIKSFWNVIENICPKYGCFPKASKSYVIVKNQNVDVTSVIFNKTDVKITTEGHGHFGAVIGSKKFKSRHIRTLLNDLNQQLLLL